MAKVQPQEPQNKLEEYTNQNLQEPRPKGGKGNKNNNAAGSNQLATDEDAEIKRAILQLIYVNDLQSLAALLQIKKKDSTDRTKGKSDREDALRRSNFGDLYEFNCSQNNSAVLNNTGDPEVRTSSFNLQEKIQNLNWHDQHIKTNLDQKITPLTQAAYLGRKQIVELMLDNYMYLDLNLPTVDNSYSAVAAACMSGHFDIVSLLCENGVDVNQVDSNQQSPLTYCFSRLNEDGNHFENKALALKMAEVLLSYGADINIYSHGRTILMNFCRQKYTYMKPIQQILLIEVIQFLM